jgi:hypothetical protein
MMGIVRAMGGKIGGFLGRVSRGITEEAEKSGKIAMIAQKLSVVARSLHSFAGVPRTARKKKPGNFGRDDGAGCRRVF